MMTLLYYSVGTVDTTEYAYCVVSFKMTEWVGQRICIKFCIKLEHSSEETIQMIEKVTAMGNWWLAASSWQHICSCITSRAEFFFAKHQITQVTQPAYCPDLVPWNFRIFPKLESPLKRKRIQTINEIQGKYDENSWWWLGELCEGPRCRLWRGLRCHCPVHKCFLNLVSSSVNVSFSDYMAGNLLERLCILTFRDTYLENTLKPLSII